ncbi:hypothetical protein VTH82DRAFT_6732 [Thermothelomyces myriococcoides]
MAMAMAATTTRKKRRFSGIVRLAGLAAILALSQPALAAFRTVTEYYAIVQSLEDELCLGTKDCEMSTTTLRVNPKVTPTAEGVTTRTSLDFDDIEVVTVILTTGVAKSDLLPTDYSSRPEKYFVFYAVMATYTAPSSCPVPFTFTTDIDVRIPTKLEPYVEVLSRSTKTIHGVYPTVHDGTYLRTTKTLTDVWLLVDTSWVPPSELSATAWNRYHYQVNGCHHPTASDPYEIYGTGGGGIEAWVIVVATVLPTVFLLGFIESYFWFRRMMLGKPALRLGTFCWCCLCLWFVLLTRRSPGRSPRDQVLLRQFWDALSARTRIKLWLRHGFRWRYPVELIGNPGGSEMILPTFGPAPRPADGPEDADGQAPPPPYPPPPAPAERAELPPHASERHAQQQQQQQHPSFYNSSLTAMSPVELSAYQSTQGPAWAAPGAGQQRSFSYSPAPVNKETAELP